jgi:hypothetical protein
MDIIHSVTISKVDCLGRYCAWEYEKNDDGIFLYDRQHGQEIFIDNFILSEMERWRN